MTYETVLKATGDGCEAVVTLSGHSAPWSAGDIEDAKEQLARAFALWFDHEPETVAVVANCPVQESDDPGRMSD